jgi:hypothetical protein
MGALRGNASYLRCFVEGKPGRKNAAQEFEKAIEARRFRGLSPRTEETLAKGWAPVEAPFDEDMAITRDAFWFGEFIAVSYREDSVVIPKPIVDHLTARRLAELEQSGQPTTRQTKRAVQATVIAEVKNKVLPRPRVMDLVWDYPNNELRIFGRGPMATERAVELFSLTFSVRVELAHYGVQAFALDMSLRAKGVLEQITPGPFFDL